MNHIYWAGDSTVQYNSIETYPQNGIGQVFHLFVKPEVQVHNMAKNGRSTKSFIDEGRLAEIESMISEGDFFFIQFGHNDEKIQDPTRYTTPDGTFIENLGIFAKVAKDHGAHPVFITPIERRCFGEDGKLGPGEHGAYVAGMKKAAELYHVPLIDLYSESRKILNDLGPKDAEILHLVCEPGRYPGFPEGKDDHTHLSYRGAVCYASVIAEGMRALGGIYAEPLLEIRQAEHNLMPDVEP